MRRRRPEAAHPRCDARHLPELRPELRRPRARRRAQGHPRHPRRAPPPARGRAVAGPRVRGRHQGLRRHDDGRGRHREDRQARAGRREARRQVPRRRQAPVGDVALLPADDARRRHCRHGDRAGGGLRPHPRHLQGQGRRRCRAHRQHLPVRPRGVRLLRGPEARARPRPQAAHGHAQRERLRHQLPVPVAALRRREDQRL
mmetsp:Transcript_31607/g.97671  ORF Transcript_31607/g.97671 Transcript_31607/m.97671 type:complete len:201 (+) Transcript_31607:999-1601(+)